MIKTLAMLTLAPASDLFERQSERERERIFSTSGSFSECLLQLGLAWAESRSPELHPNMPCGWQGPK